MMDSLCPLLTLRQQEVATLSFSSSPVDGATPRQALTVSGSFVCDIVPSLAASEESKPSPPSLFILPTLWHKYSLVFNGLLED